MHKLNLNKFWDYFLVFLLIATSGIEFFYYNDEYIIIGLIIAVAVLVLRNLSNKLDWQFFLILGIFFLWEIFQQLYFNYFSIISSLGTATRFLFAYLVIKITNKSFAGYYIKVLSFLAVISLIFYALFFLPHVIQVFVGFAEHYIKRLFYVNSYYADIDKPNIILFNFYGYDFSPPRNSGPFWEPGAYAIFLNIAILFNIIKTKKIFGKRNLIFITAVLTTLSTTGYLVLFFILTSSYYVLQKDKVKKVILILPLLAIFCVAFINLDFLFPEIKASITVADETTSSRFGSALADYYLFVNNPIIGYGRGTETRYSTSTWDLRMHRNNGLTFLLTQWGAILFLFYLYLYKRSFNHLVINNSMNNSYSWIIFMAILLSGFSEGIFQYPLFYSFISLQFISYKSKSQKVISLNTLLTYRAVGNSN